MNRHAHAHRGAHATPATAVPARLPHRCACGAAAGLAGPCPDCARDKALRLQARLATSLPGDRFEHEADQAAAQVLAGGTAPALTALDAAPLQRDARGAGGAVPAPAAAAVRTALAGGGKPLDGATRGFMESRFGHDFSRVRIHADPDAAASARAVQARAYTLGEDIAFAGGEYAPASLEGRRLLAHELAHVVQQRSGAALMRAPAAPANPLVQQFRYDRTQFDDRFDAEVDAANHRVTLVMRLNFEDLGAPEDMAERIARFRLRAKDVIERAWSYRYALQSACQGQGDKFEARVHVETTAQNPHQTISVWPETANARSNSTNWQQDDTQEEERTGMVLVDPRKPPTGQNVRQATFRQTAAAHEFGHLMGLSHVVCSGNEDRCYGITAEQKMDIMGIGSVVSPRDYAPFVRIMQRYGLDRLPRECNTWRLVAPG